MGRTKGKGTRGDAATNVILFLVLLLAAIIIVLWYGQTLRPTRLVMGTISADLEGVHQHFVNACGVTVYNATYLLSTTNGVLTLNGTEVCLETETFSRCEPLPCTSAAARVEVAKRTLLRFEKNAGPVAVSDEP